jgi:hypothetical protein
MRWSAISAATKNWEKVFIFAIVDNCFEQVTRNLSALYMDAKKSKSVYMTNKHDKKLLLVLHVHDKQA